jgi:hypothetical protein
MLTESLLGACAAVKIPKYDVTEELKKVDGEFEPLLKSSEELAAFSKKRHEEIQKEIATIDEETVRCTLKPPDGLLGARRLHAQTSSCQDSGF